MRHEDAGSPRNLGGPGSPGTGGRALPAHEPGMCAGIGPDSMLLPVANRMGLRHFLKEIFGFLFPKSIVKRRICFPPVLVGGGCCCELQVGGLNLEPRGQGCPSQAPLLSPPPRSESRVCVVHVSAGFHFCCHTEPPKGSLSLAF